jgi:hypothetical protein
MNRRAISIPVMLVLAVALATSAADAARTTRHSGTVLAIDLERRVMVVGEVGPWRLERGETAVTRRTISLTRETQFNLFMRVNRPGAFAGDFIEVALDAEDVAPDDFVTAECVQKEGRLVAVTVTVAELGAP